jgi:hypothetical protein
VKPDTTDVTRRSELRGRAEKQIRQSTRAIPESNLLKLIHELEVHRVELEMQTRNFDLASYRSRIPEKNFDL